MSTPTDRIADLLPLLDRELQRDIKHLREIEAWAFAQQPFKVGDEVVIETAPHIGCGSGWWSSREFLIEGSTGTIRDVHFYSDRWGVIFKPDVQWVTSDTLGHRFEDQPASFYFDPNWLRRRKKKDLPLTIPSDTKPWRS